ncbi:HAD family hydrolase [Aestuariivivens sediminicola]|uniref:HAD family hydrolase n=1 Tax=Aestuariivivens sediminicola TaxID=2913560 RepID=UPI001F5AB3E3|nr:HAD family hydrolase [Aestuariivivens sediminicola]
MKYKCIIFDCDGVLVDSEGISTRILVEMSRVLGAEIEMNFALDYFSGKSLHSILEFIEGRINKKLPGHFEQDFRKQSFKAFKTELKPIKGIVNVLNNVTVPYCVASSGPPEKIRLNLTTTGLIEKFENRIFSSYEIGSWKPDPGIFEHAARTMGFKPSECVVIEDSVAGIKAARTGGFDVFGFAKGNNHSELERLGAQIFFEMEKLLDMLNEY